MFEKLNRRLTARKLRTGADIVETQFFGCRMLVRPKEDVGRNMALGEFETDDLQHFMRHVKDGDTILDIGANVGAYCVPIAKRFSGARVYAFEPIPLNAALIDVSILINRLKGLQVIRKCVSDSSGTVEFSLAEDSAYSSMLDTHRKPEIETFQCQSTSLDDFCASQREAVPDIMKIDVEGAEMKVLEGAASVFEATDRTPRLVLIELYDMNLSVFNTSISAVTDRMQRWGYRAYVLIEGSRVPFEPVHHNIHYNVFFERR